MSVFSLTQKKHVKGLTQIENGQRCARRVDVNQVLRRRVFSHESENTSSQLLTLKHTTTTVYMTSFEERLKVCVFVFLCIFLTTLLVKNKSSSCLREELLIKTSSQLLYI